MKIMILGGYGVFGGRLVELLSDVSSLEVLICGRSKVKAEKFCAAGESPARRVALVVDRGSIESALRQHQPDVLVDASGPFQEYGDNPYSVVESCIRQSVNYLDLADGSDFVLGIDQFDQPARNAGIFVLSGVSSFPVLTAAVLKEIQETMRIRTVTGGIAPSPYAGVGMNVMRAVLGYAGQAVKLRRGGVEADALGMVENIRYTVAPPGELPLHNLRYSLVDVPDLRVIPNEITEIEDIWFGAGPVPEFLHRSLNLLGYLRSKFGLPALTSLATICHWFINHIRYGEHRGGMFIEVSGETGRGVETKSWHLLAEGDDGPYIPSMAAEMVVRKILQGDSPGIGARPGTSALTFDDYLQVFNGRKIVSGFRSQAELQNALFPAVLGECFAALPHPLQQLHEGREDREWTGRVGIESAGNIFGRMVAFVFGFPLRTMETSASVLIEQIDAGERWIRTFGEKSFQSSLTLGKGRDRYLICERFGWVTILMAIVWKEERLWFVPRRWRLGRLPLPKSLLPTGRSFESVADGKFAFDVTIEAPVVGFIVRYRGTLERGG